MANSLYDIYPTSSTTSTPKFTRIVGNPTDLASAKSIFGDKVSYIDATNNPKINLTKDDYVLGGTGAAGMSDYTDEYVNSSGAKRLYGPDSKATKASIQSEYNSLYPGSVVPSMPGMPTKDENGYYHSQFMPYPTLKSMDQYKSDALASLTPDVNTKKTNIDTALNSAIDNYNLLKKSAQSQADKDIVAANTNTERAKANDFNNALSHGLSRSSIMDSGQGYADIANNVNKANIQSSLAGRLGDINTNITTAQNNAALEKSNIDNSLKDLVTSTANNYYDRDWNRLNSVYGINNSVANSENNLTSSQAAAKANSDQQAFQNGVTLRGLDQKDRAMDIDQQQANTSASKASSSGSSKTSLPSVTEARNGLLIEAQDYLNNRDSAKYRDLIDNEKDAIVKTFGYDVWKHLNDVYWNWMSDPSKVNENSVIDYKPTSNTNTIMYSPYQ